MSYTRAQKLLHRIALGSRAVGEMAFDLDQARTGADGARVRDGAHVFVAGLARAGTTALMRAVHDSGAFRSLTYAAMPFVMAPSLNTRITGRGRVSEATERAHGDGIAVNEESPEALEEVFWRLFDGPAYIGRDHLRPHAPDAALIERFRDYVAAVLTTTGQARYLSKNNNNILRLPAIVRAFPNAVILVPFRDPATHAASLLAQHRRFTVLHAEDPFTLAYMGWLGHHEFGSDHRPFAPEAGGDPETLDYWLGQWTAVYGRLAEGLPAQARLVCYEDLCDDPAVWARLARDLGIDHGAALDGFRRKPGGNAPGGAALDKARAVYEALRGHEARAAA